jgi:hypothetical protein
VSTNLTRFLATLATDPDLLAAYLRDRNKVIREAGLSLEDVAALRSGDGTTLAARLNRERSAAMSPAPSSSSPTPATYATVGGVPIVSLLPQPTLVVSVPLSGAPRHTGQGNAQVPCPPYDPHGPIPTFTHLVYTEPPLRDVWSQAPQARAAGQDELEAGPQAQGGTGPVYEPCGLIPTFTHLVYICPESPPASAQRSASAKSSGDSETGPSATGEPNKPRVLEHLSH